MTPDRLMRMAAALLALCVSTATLTGCWDSRELEEQSILTGVALDVSDTPDQISVTAQVANIQPEQSGSGGGEGGADPYLVLRANGATLLECLTEIERDDGHKLLSPHNQIRLFGIELAEQGITEYLDMAMRDKKARFEVPLAIVDGRAEDALTAKLFKLPISGIFLGEMFRNQSSISKQYRVRLIDFVQKLLDDAAAPVLPIIEVIGEGEKQDIKTVGMAVFRDGKMIGRLSNEETIGYILSLGDVKTHNLAVSDGESRAVLHVNVLRCEREVELRQDGGVRVTLQIDSVVSVAELDGFSQMKLQELLIYLENMAQEEIKNEIMSCFAIAQGLEADIFGLCTMVYKKYPRQWSDMKDRWGELFADIELDVQVKTLIPETGEIVQSIEMEESMKNEDR